MNSATEKETKRNAELARAMYLEMRDLLGSGYVPDYYEQAAAPFIQIALRFMESQRQ